MRSTILLLVAASGASANWLRWSGNKEPVWTPRATGYVAEEDRVVGFTPKPTQAPGAESEGDHVLDLLRRATTSWENSATCGWLSASSSVPFVCGSSSSCATNSNNVVGCVSGTNSPFFSVCFDYAAYQGGGCNSIGSNTGCCEQSQYPACGTYIWSGSPVRSMYRCFSSTTIVDMLDVPQFVIDASLSSKTASTSTSSSTDAGSTTSSASTTSTTNSNGGGGGGNSSSNTGAIVGGVVGGVAVLALIGGLVAFFLIRNKKNRKKAAYNAVPVNENNTQHQPGAGTPAMAYAGGAGPTTYPPQEPFYPAAGQHDPRQSYVQPFDPNTQHQQYDPSKYGHYPMGNMHPGTSGSPDYNGYQYSQATGSTGVGAPHQSVVASELDNTTAVPAGHQSNPVEMSTSPGGR